MNKIILIALWTMLCLGFVMLISCGDDDDDDSDGGDDDAVDDDTGDDDTTDDDTGDDDTGDDDTTDDDTGDDDTGDDDTGDDDTGDDETWTDTASGLTWTIGPAMGARTWDEAKSYCTDLTTTGGGWHLPTISELRTLIRGCEGTVAGGTCGVTDSCLDLTCQDDSCHDCSEDGGPNDGCYNPAELLGPCNWYWSSSEVADSASDLAWVIKFEDGHVYFDSWYDLLYVRCVR